MNLHNLAKTTEKLVIDNSPGILTGLGVTGAITAAYLTGKATFKAAEIIEEASPRVGLSSDRADMDFFSNKEKVQLVWKEYIPAVGMLGVTVVCIIASNRIGSRRAAALATAYTLSEKAFEEYKEKVIEKIGPNKEQQVRDEVAQDRVNNTPAGVIVIGGGEVLCFDLYTGRYFQSSMETIKKAQNDTNYQILNNMFASLGDFHDRIGLAVTPYSEEVGWNVDHMIEISFSTVFSDDQRPCLAIEYKVAPIRGYARLQ